MDVIVAAIIAAVVGLAIGIGAGYFVRKNISEAKIGEADSLAYNRSSKQRCRDNEKRKTSRSKRRNSQI